MSRLRIEETINRLRVRVGLLLAFAVVALAHPTWAFFLPGVIVSALGLLIRAWASGHLRKEKELTVSGPYRYSRNPLYLGNLVIGVGIVVGAYSWWFLGLFAAYFGIFYPLIVRRERDRMKRLFPQKYEEYGKKVPLFFPSFKKGRSSPSRFSWPLYRQNKEYRAVYGTALFWLVVAVKMLTLNR
ncbi:MAG: isoprenylcysteine carboxylmethyltransferase family protein [Acidobacteriota bacterium]